MSFGITATGFKIKRLADIKGEWEDSFRSKFGKSVNLDARTPEGQLIGIASERESLLWELAEQLYYAAYPDTAEGVPLDNAVAITGTERKGATFSIVQAWIRGTQGTVVPNTFEVSVFNDPDARFKLDSPVTIQAGVDEVQTISYSPTPTSGSFRLNLDGETSALINWDDTNGEIETTLEALPNIADVSVTGSFAAGHVITFINDSGSQEVNLMTVSNNTLDAGGAVAVAIVETVEGLFPQVLGSFTAKTKGSLQAPSESLTVIETPITGVDSVLNDLDATIGEDDESDSDLKLRREQEVAQAGKATLAAIKASLTELNGVTAAIVFHNNTDTTDIFGRPSSSIDCVVEGGDNQEIADDIFDTAGAGIGYFGSIEMTVVDDDGFDQSVRFSRPTEIPIWIEVDLTTNAEFPANGIALVEQAILDYGNNLEIGNDVIVYTPLISAIGSIEGIIDTVIRIGLADFIASGSQVATFSSSAGDLLVTSAGHGLSDDMRVRFSNTGGALPTGIIPNRAYYVSESDTNTLKLKIERDQDVIAFTDAGTGTTSMSFGGLDDNITIGLREKAGFDSSRITAVEI